ncbi:MAG: hypothetical protein F4063_00925 [Chloroflexi bacterium]|nr:hypothetical protein [Chloroflexota bacterium]
MNQAAGTRLAAWLNRLVDFAPVLIALLLALLVSYVLLVALNVDPLSAFGFMLEGAVGTETPPPRPW